MAKIAACFLVAASLLSNGRTASAEVETPSVSAVLNALPKTSPWVRRTDIRITVEHIAPGRWKCTVDYQEVIRLPLWNVEFSGKRRVIAFDLPMQIATRKLGSPGSSRRGHASLRTSHSSFASRAHLRSRSEVDCQSHFNEFYPSNAARLDNPLEIVLEIRPTIPEDSRSRPSMVV